MSVGNPKVVSFVGRSGTGKTTFLEKLIPELSRRGIRVLVVKHDVHGFSMDSPGKDTYRLKEAGACRVVIANDHKLAFLSDLDGDLPLRVLAARFGQEVDLVLSEGYRRSGAPKVLVAREAAPTPFDSQDPAVDEAIAVVTDHRLDLPAAIPQLPLDDPSVCADLLVERFCRQKALDRVLTGVLLAGGRSERMGEPKEGLSWEGEPLLPQLVERLAPVCSGGILVVRRDAQQLLPSLPSEATVVEDLLPQHAALGGLYTGLALAETPFCFVAGCDMPLLDAEAVAWLAAQPPAEADLLLPVHGGRPQPLHAVYGHRCLAAIKESLLSGELRMDSWLGSVRVERIGPDRLAGMPGGDRSFFNANRPSELAEAVSLAESPGDCSEGADTSSD